MHGVLVAVASLPITIAHDAPSPKSENEINASCALLRRKCSEQSSTAITKTTASGSLLASARAVRSAATPPKQPMNPSCNGRVDGASPSCSTRSQCKPGAANPVHVAMTRSVTRAGSTLARASASCAALSASVRAMGANMRMRSLVDASRIAAISAATQRVSMALVDAMRMNRSCATPSSASARA